MSKTYKRPPLTKEELIERHEFKLKMKKEQEALLKEIWDEELRSFGHGNDDPQQGSTVHKK